MKERYLELPFSHSHLFISHGSSRCDINVIR